MRIRPIDVALGKDKAALAVLTLIYNALYLLRIFTYFYWPLREPPGLQRHALGFDAFYLHWNSHGLLSMRCSGKRRTVNLHS
jgi:hypothetical protein